MQIPGNNLSLPAGPRARDEGARASAGGKAAQRLATEQAAVTRQDTAGLDKQSRGDQASVNDSVTTKLSAQERVEAGRKAERSNFQRIPSFDELPARNRTALNSYLDNAATPPSSQSASELAGIDVFV